MPKTAPELLDSCTNYTNGVPRGYNDVGRTPGLPNSNVTIRIQSFSTLWPIYDALRHQFSSHPYSVDPPGQTPSLFILYPFAVPYAFGTIPAPRRHVFLSL